MASPTVRTGELEIGGRWQRGGTGQLVAIASYRLNEGGEEGRTGPGVEPMSSRSCGLVPGRCLNLIPAELLSFPR